MGPGREKDKTKKLDLTELLTGPPLAKRLAAHGIRENLIAVAERTVSDIRLDRPLAALETQLPDDEPVEFMALGRHDKRVGLVVVTDRRVLFQPVDQQAVAVALQRYEVQAEARKGKLTLRTVDAALAFDRFLGRSAEMLAEAISASAG